MRQMAEDMAIGLACSWCGNYFTKAHNHPVLCENCQIGQSDDRLEKMKLKKSIYPKVEW